MSEVIIFGIALSSYVRTARMTCAEKGVSHKFQVQPPHSPEQKAVHPFGKVPAFQHGDVKLWETSAICRYVDQAFDGPSLTPASAADAAVMEQWISAVNCYLYRDLVAGYALRYVLPGFRGEPPDRAAIDKGLPALEAGLMMYERALDGKDWLAGDTLSLADLFVAPIIQTVGLFSEAQAILEKCPNARRVHGAMETRASYKLVHPPQA